MQKFILTPIKPLLLALVLLASFSAAGADKKKETAVPAQQAPKKKREIQLSVFEIPTTPVDGRDPFFPRKTTAVATPNVPVTTPVRTDVGTLVLNGITSPPRQTAMINGHTFEPGEEAEVRVPEGYKLLLKCERIAKEACYVLVNGNFHRELRLRNGI